METVYFIIPEYESKWKVSLNGVSPPTGPTYLYTYAKSINFGNYRSGKCIDASIHYTDEVISKMDKSDLVCLTTTVSNYNQVIEFAKKSKDKGAKVVIGGPYATVKAKQISEKQTCFDHIVCGEGESALSEILFGRAQEKILSIQNLSMYDLPKINFSGWTDNDLRTYQENYKKMLKSGNYGKIPEEIPFFVFYQSSRGCVQKPRCGFCGSRLGENYNARTGEQLYLDLEGIIEQISLINKRIHIFDCSDSFTTGIDRLDNLDRYCAFPEISLTVYARSDEITNERAKKLRKIGVTKVSIGIETGSNNMMRQIGKGIDVSRDTEVAKILADNGISMYVNLLYGIPNETPTDLQRTVDHFEELTRFGNIYRVAARVTTPLPKSRWYFDLLTKIKETSPKLRNRIHNNDKIDLEEIQKLWISKMTNLSFEDILQAHSRLVQIAKVADISISSEYPRGIA